MKNLVPTLKVRLRDDWKGTGGFFGIILLLDILFIIILPNVLPSHGEESYAASGFVSSIYVFVISIMMLRQYLRLCIQNGTGRKTMFTTHVISGLITSIGIGIFGEIVLFLLQLVGKGSLKIYVSDVYYILFKDVFVDSQAGVALSDRLLSIMTIFGVSLCIYAVGTFISAALFRLPKPWTYIVGFGVPFVLLNASPFVFKRSEAFAELVKSVFEYALGSPYHLFVVMIIGSFVFMVLSWLVVRRTPIKSI